MSSTNLQVWWVLLAPAVTAQAPGPSAPPRSDFQSWNELDISARLAPVLDVTWDSKVRFSTGLENPAAYIFGADFNFRLSNGEIGPSQTVAAL